jgi:hypothetical protein
MSGCCSIVPNRCRTCSPSAGVRTCIAHVGRVMLPFLALSCARRLAAAVLCSANKVGDTIGASFGRRTLWNKSSSCPASNHPIAARIRGRKLVPFSVHDFPGIGSAEKGIASLSNNRLSILLLTSLADAMSIGIRRSLPPASPAFRRIAAGIRSSLRRPTADGCRIPASCAGIRPGGLPADG